MAAGHYHDTPVLVLDAFEMGGKMVASVAALQPIFTTEGKVPGRPTRYGWVPLDELTRKSDLTDAQRQALENWEAAMAEADALENMDCLPANLAAAYAFEVEAESVFHASLVSLLEIKREPTAGTDDPQGKH